MAHIDLGNDFPGIRGPMMFRPDTARPLNELVDVLAQVRTQFGVRHHSLGNANAGADYFRVSHLLFS